MKLLRCLVGRVIRKTARNRYVFRPVKHSLSNRADALCIDTVWPQVFPAFSLAARGCCFAVT